MAELDLSLDVPKGVRLVFLSPTRPNYSQPERVEIDDVAEGQQLIVEVG
jgi:hypothetical protein